MLQSTAKMLSGRLALVTGGARGIGKAICLAFDREGAQVIAADLDEDVCREKTMQEMTHSDGHMAIRMDVADPDSVAKGFEAIMDKYKKPPSIVINNAGLFKLDGYLMDMKAEDFDKTMEVNVKGTFLVSQTGAKLMKEHGVQGGSIINMSSIAGKSGTPGAIHYCSSKHAVIGFTKCASMELARYGIRVNCICPGYINTRLGNVIPDETKKKILPQIPLGVWGQPEDIAETAAFLASEKAKYITGAAIDVNGGLI